MDIRGRIALVTGAAEETGRTIAVRLADEGARVVIADIAEPSGRSTVAEILGRGGTAAFVRTDVTDDADVARMFDFARDWHGAPTILVNNAGGGGHVEPHFPDATEKAWSKTLELNLRGPMLATQLALAGMQAVGEGAVINISSTGGLGYRPYHSPEYAAGKAGLIRFTVSLTSLHTRMGVRVNCIVPDWIETERAQAELAAMSAEERAGMPTPVPMDDIADQVVRLARDDTLAGRVLVMFGGEEPRLLDDDRRD